MTGLRWEHTQTAPSTWRAESGPYLAIVRRAHRASGAYWAARVERHDVHLAATVDMDLAELTPLDTRGPAHLMRVADARAWCADRIDAWAAETVSP